MQNQNNIGRVEGKPSNTKFEKTPGSMAKKYKKNYFFKKITSTQKIKPKKCTAKCAKCAMGAFFGKCTKLFSNPNFINHS